MKKSLLAAAILASVSGAASAATSVTLYGIVDVGYTTGSTKEKTGAVNVGSLATPLANDPTINANVKITEVTNFGLSNSATPYRMLNSGAPSSTKTTNKVEQKDGYKDDSRIGVKGQEDLGNGLSAIFDVQFRFKADEGKFSNDLAHSYVGLKGSFGELTIGRRETITDDLFGYSSNAKEIDGQVGATWNNNLSYRGSFGGLTAGVDLTTGESVPGLTSSREQQYAAGVEYSFGAGAVAAGYEHSEAGKHAYALGLKYKVGPVEMFARASKSKQSYDGSYMGSLTTNLDKSIRGTGFAAGVNYNITSNDVLGLSYSQLKRTSDSTLYSTVGATSYSQLDVSERTRLFSMDYSHSLSKRTSVYAGASMGRVKSAASAADYNSVGAATTSIEVPSYTSKKYTSYTVGVKHAF